MRAGSERSGEGLARGKATIGRKGSGEGWQGTWMEPVLRLVVGATCGLKSGLKAAWPTPQAAGLPSPTQGLNRASLRQPPVGSSLLALPHHSHHEEGERCSYPQPGPPHTNVARYKVLLSSGYSVLCLGPRPWSLPAPSPNLSSEFYRRTLPNLPPSLVLVTPLGQKGLHEVYPDSFLLPFTPCLLVLCSVHLEQ